MEILIAIVVIEEKNEKKNIVNLFEKWRWWVGAVGSGGGRSSFIVGVSIALESNLELISVAFLLTHRSKMFRRGRGEVWGVVSHLLN